MTLERLRAAGSPPSRGPCTYDVLPIRRYGAEVAVYLHRDAPLIAFFANDEFVDRPALAAHFTKRRAVTRAELVAPFEAGAAEALLGGRALSSRDVECWNPPTVGDALFNDWD